jgi:hypothetical protein
MLGFDLSRKEESTVVLQSIEIEERVRYVLVELGVPYELIPMMPPLLIRRHFANAMASRPSLRQYNYRGVKRQPKQYGACLVLATTRLDVNRGQKLMGASRVSFAASAMIRWP